MTDQDGDIPHPANDEDPHNNYTLRERLSGAHSSFSLDLPQTVRVVVVKNRRHQSFPQIPPQMANFTGIKVKAINVDLQESLKMLCYALFFLSRRFRK
jgi:hypothetical protein